MQTKVIGLAGVKRAGKNTVALMINEFVPTHETALADKLKIASSKAFDLPLDFFNDQALKEEPLALPRILTVGAIVTVLEEFNIYKNKYEIDAEFGSVINMTLTTPRKIAQTVGTEVLRKTGDAEIHCRNTNIKRNQINVVTDIRFPNEFSYFKENFGENFLPLYIQRDEAEKVIDNHPSETSVFLFSDKCVRIDNNGGLSDTERSVKKALDEFLFGKKG